MKRTPEYNATYMRKWYRAWKKRDPEGWARTTREQRLKQKFGITIKVYEELLDEQDGRCAICGTMDPGGRGRFHVDHDHITGSIRALLCSRCNLLLGKIEKARKSGLLDRMIEYLERF